MTKNLVAEIIAEIMLEAIREKKGRLTEVSTECSINRQEFDVEGLTNLKLYRLLRLVQALVHALPRARYEQMKNDIAEVFWKSIDDLDDDSYDESGEQEDF